MRPINNVADRVATLSGEVMISAEQLFKDYCTIPMQIPDGFGWSPDGGRFESRAGAIYWDDGDVTVLKPGDAIRYMMDSTVKS